MMEKAGKMMQFFSDAGFACRDDQTKGLFEGMGMGLPPPPAVAQAVKERRHELRNEKNRGRTKKGKRDDE